MKIAEVVSRIDDKGKFIKKVESMGFKLVNNKVYIFNFNYSFFMFLIREFIHFLEGSEFGKRRRIFPLF